MNAQEQFWAGDFGSEYLKRNRVRWEDRVPFWRQILAITQCRSVLDVGCNAGWNQRAIRAVDRTIVTTGCDINADAMFEAREDGLDVRLASLYSTGNLFCEKFDLVATTGVLIHVPPRDLREAMLNISVSSKRWVLAVEYDAPKEEEVLYRGNAERLWKRPFGALYQQMGLELIADSEAEGFDRCRAWLMVKR